MESEYSAYERKKRESAYDWAAKLWVMANSNGRVDQALEVASRFRDSAPAVYSLYKSAVDAGSFLDAEFTNGTATYNQVSGPFVTLIQNKSLLGVLQCEPEPYGLRRLTETGVPTADFVDEGLPIPVGRYSYDASDALQPKKISFITAFVNELFDSFSSEVARRLNESMALPVARGIDRALIGPLRSGSAGGPASLLYGVTETASTGSSAAQVETDIGTLFAPHAAISNMRRCVVVMSTETALHMTKLRSSGVRVFPDLTLTGGSILGVPVYVTVAAKDVMGSPSSNVLAVINGERVRLADDGRVTVSPSRIASIQMDSAPTNQSTATATGATLVSAFQTETRFFRVSRWMDWKRADSAAATWMRVAY